MASTSSKNVMPQGFLLNGQEISQETYTELCINFPEQYGDDAERLQKERKEKLDQILKDLSLEASPSQVLKSPFSVSSSPLLSTPKPSTPQPLPNPTTVISTIDEEGESSPEVSLK